MNKVSVWAKTVRGLFWLLGQLPLGVLYGLGSAIAWFLKSIFRYRRSVIDINLARSFPEEENEWLNSVAKRYYKRIGNIVAEAVWFGGCTGERGRRRLKKQGICEYTNFETLINARKDRGVIVFRAHTGNWELVGGILEYVTGINAHDYMEYNDVHVANRALNNKTFDYVMSQNRQAPVENYTGMVETNSLLRDMLAHKADRPVYILISDQSPYKGAHPVGMFLNQPTNGMLGPFTIASKLGFAVLYCHDEIVDRGHYRLTLEVIADNAKGQDPEKMMRKYYNLLEEDIRKDPVNWLWSHKRWKRAYVGTDLTLA